MNNDLKLILKARAVVNKNRGQNDLRTYEVIGPNTVRVRENHIDRPRKAKTYTVVVN
jgi:hypothetical protein